MSNEHEVINIIADNLIYIRKRNELSLTAMAKSIGITLSSLKMLEAAQIPPRMPTDFLFRIQDIYKISISDFTSKKLSEAEE